MKLGTLLNPSHLLRDRTDALKKLHMFGVGCALTGALTGCAVFGENSTGMRLKRLQSSPHYHTQEKILKNANASFKMGGNYFAMLKEMILGSQIRFPTEPLPEVRPDWSALRKESDQIKFIWFGHSTFFVHIDGKSILIDPVFGDYASPVPIFGKRFQAPLARAADFPRVDIILISHDHYDHLEMETVQHFAKTNAQFLVPLGIGAHLEKWGVNAERITEMDWWDQETAAGLSIACTPAQHFSGRSGLNANDTLWASWVVQGRTKKFFYSGDSGYFTHFKEIGDKYGPFDLTFLENGQYNDMWKEVHQMPEQAVAAHIDLKGIHMVPVHWGAYQLAFHDWFEPIERVTREAKQRQVRLISPKLGELIDLAQPRRADPWWQQSPDLKKAR